MKLFKYALYKRIFDIVFSVFCLFLFAIPLLLLAVIIIITSGSPVLYRSERTGKNNRKFMMLKLRTMTVGTPQLSSEHLTNPENYIIKFGKFLRKSGLDELPQLFNILRGEMSFVGPRPVIADDDELLILRISKGIDKLIPGLTGLAQINGRCNLPTKDKIKLEKEYLDKFGFMQDIKIMIYTNFYLIKENISEISLLKNTYDKQNYKISDYLSGNLIKKGTIL